MRPKSAETEAETQAEVEVEAEATPFDDPFRDYAWSYFSLHADQRMKAFHFYIILSTAILGTLALAIKNNDFQKWMAIFGVFLIFFSFVFWKFDQRTSQLIKHAEAALIFLDNQHLLDDDQGMPHVLKIFARERATTTKLKLYPLMFGHFSYSRSLRWVFLMFSAIGTALIIVCCAPPASPF